MANIGRKPYRSLSGDIVQILQDHLRLLLPGEVIWRKGEGASGSCAWGSFRSADGDMALRAVGPAMVFDAIEMLADDQRARLRDLRAGWTSRPAGVWLLDREGHRQALTVLLRLLRRRSR